jgi:hypothetical protein
LALTSLTSGGLSVGIVRSRTKDTEGLFFVFFVLEDPQSPAVDSVSNRNKYQQSAWGVKTRPPRETNNLNAICEDGFTFLLLTLIQENIKLLRYLPRDEIVYWEGEMNISLYVCGDLHTTFFFYI